MAMFGNLSGFDCTARGHVWKPMSLEKDVAVAQRLPRPEAALGHLCQLLREKPRMFLTFHPHFY